MPCYTVGYKGEFSWIWWNAILAVQERRGQDEPIFFRWEAGDLQLLNWNKNIQKTQTLPPILGKFKIRFVEVQLYLEAIDKDCEVPEMSLPHAFSSQVEGQWQEPICMAVKKWTTEEMTQVCKKGRCLAERIRRDFVEDIEVEIDCNNR